MFGRLIATGRNGIRAAVWHTIAHVTCAAIAGTAAQAGSFRVVNLPRAEATAYEAVAERCYRQQATFWLGRPLPELADTCEISVTPRGGGGGTTRYVALPNGQVYGWNMRVQGSPQQLKRSIIPHEVNHVIFAAYFGRHQECLFDEGAAATRESETERAGYARVIAEGLQFGDLMPARSLIDRQTYPAGGRRTAVFYAESHMIAEALVARNGPRRYVEFLADGRKPSRKLSDYYGLDATGLDRLWRAHYAAHYAAKKPAAKKLVYVFTNPGRCPPCARFERDRAAGKFAGYSFRTIDERDPEWAKASAEFRRHTGRNVPAIPTFWIPRTRQYTTGYSGPGGLLGWLLNAFKVVLNAVAQIIGGQNAIPQPTDGTLGPPDALGATQPVSTAPFEDWSGVSVVILAAEQDVGALRGKARAFAIGLSRGPIERRIAALTDGKARVLLVAERTEPNKYRAVLQAAGLEPEKFRLLVLVPRTQQSLIRSLILKKIEQIGDRKLASAPVEVIFERLTPAPYGAIMSAVQAAQPAQLSGEVPVESPGVREQIKRAAEEAALSAVGQFAKQHGVPPEVLDAAKTILERRNEPSVPAEPPPVLEDSGTWGGAGAGGVIAVLSGLMTFWKVRRDNQSSVQAAKAAFEQALHQWQPSSPSQDSAASGA